MIAQTISDENKKKLKDSDVFSAKKRFRNDAGIFIKMA